MARRGCGIAIFIQRDLIFNIRHELSVNNDDTKLLCLEIINQKSKNIFINTIYREPSVNKEGFENYVGKLLE